MLDRYSPAQSIEDTDAFPPADRADFIEGMSRVAMAVSVVTTDGIAGKDGMAITAMSSVSADGDRPTLLVCLKASSRPAPVVQANGVFCVNVLAEDQAAFSEHFSGRNGGTIEQWFALGQWSRLRSGAPALDAALVNFDCAVTQTSTVGTHHIIIGSVLAIRSAQGKPLFYVNRGYGRIAD